MQELSALAKKDPEFYKYLQENDRELLDFKTVGPSAAGEDESMDENEESDEAEKEEEIPLLTSQIIRGWQKAILEVSRVQLPTISQGVDQVDILTSTVPFAPSANYL